MGTTRDHLRQGTRAIHEQLHHHTSFQELMDETIALPAYLLLLGRLHGYHSGLEQALDSAVFPERAQAPKVDYRSQRLLKDMEDLGSSGLGHTENVAHTDIKSYGAYLGVLYVREGSMMGGRALAAKLDHLCSDQASGRSFFQGGSGDGASWQRLCRALDGLNEPEAQDQALQAALTSFQLFDTWMMPKAVARPILVQRALRPREPINP
ncbi:biliverdin-producing heme oxygenase [Aquidulcibacter sp.]|uniref:biliverdin-producing heme oxygenase n=1 Tax=Aquidulcibacter sp. TaxID=2052990 RepID=UPI0025C011F4|nr:biliverdin-producing heme oxygenase [Aquidulcibacter sp.]MCA3693210.1 biliverdin-producing heme oxygenase [Aquidulcibacter sp.]